MSCLSEALVELGFGILMLRYLPLLDPRTPPSLLHLEYLTEVGSRLTLPR